MSRFLPAAIRLCTGLVCLVSVDVTSHAQWAQWEIGSGPGGGMRYRGPLVSIEIGGTVPPPAVGRPGEHHAYALPPVALPPAPVPPWHYRHDPPQPAHGPRDQARFYRDLDRIHQYRTREQRYADDFRDRYAAGDPFYPAHPHAAAPLSARRLAAHTAPVPGLSYGPVGEQRRSFVADAEVADLLRPAANRLINSLSRKRDGRVWMKHLQPDRIIHSIDHAEFPGALADLVENYEAVLQNPRLVLIAEAEGFRDTHRLLCQYALLQSRYATDEHPVQEHEVFMNAGQHVLDEEPVVIESEPVLDPSSIQLNPPGPVLPEDAEPSSAGTIDYLPAPLGEPEPASPADIKPAPLGDAELAPLGELQAPLPPQAP